MTTLTAKTFHLQLVRETPDELKDDRVLDSPRAAYEYMRDRLEALDREHFVVVAVDARNKVIGFNTVGIGSLSAAIVHPREVFKFAILANAASIFVAHNHPSGEVSFSREDVDITHRLSKAGELLGIDVLDHIVVGDGVYASAREEGTL